MFGIQPNDLQFFLVFLVHQFSEHFDVAAAVLLVTQFPVGITGVGVSAADEHFDSRTDALLQTIHCRGTQAKLFFGIVRKPLKELTFKVGVGSFGGGMLRIPDRQLLTC